MIRFACPGCGATFSVDDAKGGKLGNCPKCKSQFQIPTAAGGPAPTPSEPASVPVPAPPAAGDPAAPVEIDPCPKCGARLSVAGSSVGSDVECPYCKEVFRAAKVGGLAAVSAGGGSRRGRRDDEDDRPSRRRDDDEDEDDRPSRRRRAVVEDDEDDRPSRRRGRRDEDEEEDDRPRRKKRRHSEEESKRIVAGILALLVGWLGVHKFYLGYTGAGVILLLLNCVGVSGIIALVEGIIYLTKTDEEFIETYQIGTKEWF